MEDTIRSSIYESIEKSTRLKEMAEKKYGTKERPKKSETESIESKPKKGNMHNKKSLPSIKESESERKSKSPKKFQKKVKRMETENRSQYVRDVNQSESNTKKQNFQEFRISDAGSKIGYEGFSESKYYQ